MEIIEKNDTETRIKTGGREIILVGTAHVSKSSVDEVVSLIKSEKPDIVCIEIDDARYKTMTEGRSWENFDIFKIIKEKKAFLLMANLVLSSFQKRLGVDVGVAPGEEMLAAIAAAKEEGIPFVLADRDVHVTLRRAWVKSNFWNKAKLLSSLGGSIFVKEKLTQEDIEKLKEKNALQSMMDDLADYMPAVKEVLIDERDRYLASNIFTSKGNKVLAVIGAGHANGIIQWLTKFESQEAQTDISDINYVPKPKLITKIAAWIVPAIIIGLIGVGFLPGVMKDSSMNQFNNILMWFGICGGMAVLGSILAGAHPVTIIVSFFAAPISVLNPLLAVGMITGLVESFFRRPTVKDFENLPTDTLTIKGFYKNRITRILLVFFIPSILVSIGNISAIVAWIVKLI